MLLQHAAPSLRTTTAHMAQTMALLELNATQLYAQVRQALDENPALEHIDERRVCPRCGRRLLPKTRCPVCQRSESADAAQPIVYTSPRDDFFTPRGYAGDDVSGAADWVPAQLSLAEHVKRQIVIELAPGEEALADFLLNSLDAHGLLSEEPVWIARHLRLNLAQVERVRSLIQRADPLGVGSRTPLEALRVQLEALAESNPAPAHTARALEVGLDALARQAYAELGQKLGVSAAHAEAIAVYIRANLNMYPAAAHWGEAAPPPSEAFFAPDVIITRHNADPDGPLVVEIISPFAGNLHLTHGFKEAVNAQIQVAQAAAQDSAASYRVRQAAEAELEKCEALSAQIEKAQLLIKCLQQRDFTLTRLLQRLVVLQRSFILDGDAESVPVTRAQLALELGLNESTISRAVADKAVQLPNGRIIELAGMFDRSLHIRTALRALIEQEDRPLSDHALANLLSAQGFPVARRTVAKYRKLEGLHPARLRRGRVAAA